MIFVLERVTQPEIEAITLAEMKRHLKEYAYTTRDDDITGLIKGAREWVEDFTARALIDQTWRLSLRAEGRHGNEISTYQPVSGYYCGSYEWRRVGEIMLRRSPALEIMSFVTVDADGAETAIDADTYALREADSRWPRVVALTGATWATAAELRITFRAGFADLTGSPQEDASVVPEVFKQAMKLWAKAHWDADEVMTPMLVKSAENLLVRESCDVGFA